MTQRVSTLNRPATSGIGVLAAFEYNGLGQRTRLARGNGAHTDYDYDLALRLSDLDHDLSGTADDLEVDFDYNPVGQITMRDGSNDAYDYDSFASVTITSIHNSLNQPTSVGGTAVTYDAPRARRRAY